MPSSTNKDYGFEQLTVVEHPLVKDKLAVLRDENTSTRRFRELITELTVLVGYEATRKLPLKEVLVKTPIREATFEKLDNASPVIIPILRAGLGMVEGFMKLMPDAVVGHLGMYRNEETLQPVPYYSNYPKEMPERDIFLLDPMLATGGSGIAAIDFVKENGGKNIHFMCIVAAREGVRRLTEAHPDVKIYSAAFDEDLTDKAYIDPGLGDAGDRLFGTL